MIGRWHIFWKHNVTKMSHRWGNESFRHARSHKLHFVQSIQAPYIPAKVTTTTHTTTTTTAATTVVSHYACNLSRVICYYGAAKQMPASLLSVCPPDPHLSLSARRHAFGPHRQQREARNCICISCDDRAVVKYTLIKIKRTRTT